METENCDASILSDKHEHLRVWSAILAILSSSASIIGCFMIIITYICWKDFRTTSRSILVFLSVADLFTAGGYVFGSGVYLNYDIYKVKTNTTACDPRNEFIQLLKEHKYDRYQEMCKWQSFVTTWSSITSFFWTTILAFYLYMTIVHKMYRFVRRLMPLIHLVCWGVPLVLCVIAVIENWLGPSVDDTAVSWCFVRHHKPRGWHHGGQLLLGKGWEIICYILIIIFYTATKIFIEVEKRRPLQFPVYASVVKLDKKVLLIPIAFLLVRSWGTLRFFLSLLPSCLHHHHHQCHNCSCDNILHHPILVYLQAIGDGGQGWANAILFIIFSARVRKRITNTVSDASWKLRSGSFRQQEDTTTINPPEDDSPTASLTTNTPTVFYGSTSPKHVK